MGTAHFTISCSSRSRYLNAVRQIDAINFIPVPRPHCTTVSLLRKTTSHRARAHAQSLLIIPFVFVRAYTVVISYALLIRRRFARWLWRVLRGSAIVINWSLILYTFFSTLVTRSYASAVICPCALVLYGRFGIVELFFFSFVLCAFAAALITVCQRDCSDDEDEDARTTHTLTRTTQWVRRRGLTGGHVYFRGDPVAIFAESPCIALCIWRLCPVLSTKIAAFPSPTPYLARLAAPTMPTLGARPWRPIIYCVRVVFCKWPSRRPPSKLSVPLFRCPVARGSVRSVKTFCRYTYVCFITVGKFHFHQVYSLLPPARLYVMQIGLCRHELDGCVGTTSFKRFVSYS